MGNEYNRFSHHHHYYHQHHHHTHLHINHRGTFLPMLCSSRPSIKDVQVPTNASFSNDSVSPKISCMGQVKRSNKVSGFPIITSQANNTTTNNIKYSKLKKLFSGRYTPTSKSATATPTKAVTATATSCGSRGRRPRVSNVKQGHCVTTTTTTTINLVDMDPPLPVIKRVPKSPQQGEEEISLWKRRSGGAALKGLQLKPVHHPRLQIQPISV